MLEPLSIAVPLIGMQIRWNKSIVRQDKRINVYLMVIFWAAGTAQVVSVFLIGPRLMHLTGIHVGLAFLFSTHLCILRTYILSVSLLAISEYVRSSYDFFKIY